MKYKLVVLLCLASVFSTCSDIFEKDISEEELYLLAPADNFVSNDGKVIFWWENLEGADYYDLQVVSPNFDQIVKLLVDSTINGNKFEQTFAAGEYEWRISGVNNSTATPWYIRSFSVVAASK